MEVAALKFQRVSPFRGVLTDTDAAGNRQRKTSTSISGERLEYVRKETEKGERKWERERKKENHDAARKGYALIRGIGRTKGNDVTSLLRGPNSNHAKPIAYTALAPIRARRIERAKRVGEEGRREAALFLSGRSAPSDSELSSCLESQPTKNLPQGLNFYA